MLIRQERDADIDAIDEVHRRAFSAPSPASSEPVEVGLVHALRADRGWIPALSLVAEDQEGAIVGHVACSEGRIAEAAVVGLGPIGVLPPHQGRRVGHALVHAVLAAADALDYPAVALRCSRPGVL